MATDRILTTHVGSLARLADVARLIAAREAGEAYDAAAYDRTVRAAVETVVRRQVELGIDIVSDGEQSKASFNNYISERLTGFERRPGAPTGAGSNWAGTRERLAFPDFYDWYGRQVAPPLSAPGVMVCTGPVTYQGGEAVQTDVANLKAAASAAGAYRVFMPAIAPTMVAATRPNEYYGSDEEYLQALADALHEEYAAILDAGFDLQIDDPRLASQYTMVPEMTIEDARAWAEKQAEAINYAIRGLPTERLRFHTCYSIDIGPRLHELAFADIVDVMLRIEVGAYSFEAANPRHEHEYHVWEKQKLPEGKALIPGVISHTTHLVEHPELIAERVVRFAASVGRENVIAGADCGFAATARMAPEIHPSVAWEKLRALAQGAELASARLWR